MKKYTIGIDMGINNVGWAVLDNETNKIESYGVRLFNPSNDAQTRRETRNTRRRMKRRDTRVDDVLTLLNEKDFPNRIVQDTNLLEKRVLGLSKKIEKQDITNILCYLVKHRGYIPFGDEEVAFEDLKGKLPCEYYYDFYKKYGKYRDTNKTVRNSDNINEIKALLNNQSKYYKELDDEFTKKYIEIFSRKRKFWEGPGSTKQLTPFGRFKTEKDVIEYNENKKENPNYEKYIFEDLIGKCKIDIGEKCAPKLNYYYELFNMLNDFINISFKDITEIDNKECFYDAKNKYHKLTTDGLDKIVKFCMNNYKLKYTDIFKKLFSTTIDNVVGYRIDKNKKPEFSTLKYYRTVLKTLSDKELDISWTADIELYNEIMRIMTITPGSVEFIAMIKNNDKISYKFNEEELNTLNELRIKFKKEGMLSYGALSEKRLKIATEDMKSLEKNFMQVRKLKKYDEEAKKYFISQYKDSNSKKYKMNKKFVDDIISSPQVKKSLRQSINVINALIDKYGLPTNIAVESTKDLNGEEKRREIEAEQRLQENLKKAAKKTLVDNFGESSVNDTNVTKIMLSEETNRHCMYCNKPMSLNEILSESCEIEHILPQSKSFDDSYNNKTISCRECNHKKGDQTPYQFLNTTFDKFEKRISENKLLSDAKKQNLLFKEDINKYTTRFFNRNLRDTAYATKELINQINIFNAYLQTVNEEYKVNTLSTPGQLTKRIRDKNNLEKDRDDGKFHHAVDASIIASITTTKIGEIMLEAQNNKEFWEKNKTGYVDKNNYLKSINIKNTIDQIKNINEENTDYSSQVLKNPQGKLSNANIYKLIKKEDKYYKIDQIDNIYSYDFSNKNNRARFEKLLDVSDSNATLLCYDKDRDTFNYISEIYNKYKDEKGNPFINYLIDTGEIEDANSFDENKHGIRMVSKSKTSKGPFIKRLRYYTSMTTPYLLNKKSINKKENTILALDSLSQFCTRVYINKDKNKFVFLPVYSVSVDLNTKIINENDEYYKKFKDLYMGDSNVEHIVDLYNGDKIEFEKPDKTIIKGIYQYFHKTNNKILLKTEEAFTKSDISLTVYDVDILGKEHKRLTYKIK